MVPVLHAINTTATVIGYVVMFAWLVLIVWMLSVVAGEFRFNRQLKRANERRSEDQRYSWIDEMQHNDHYDGDDYDTMIQSIRFKFSEDDFDTEITGAVFDIRERYPNEFA